MPIPHHLLHTNMPIFDVITENYDSILKLSIWL